MIDRAVTTDFYLKEKNIVVKEKEALISFSGGDARKLLNILELVVNAQPGPEILIDNDTVRKELQENPLMYDKDGEQHYDIISAMIKSIRMRLCIIWPGCWKGEKILSLSPGVC